MALRAAPPLPKHDGPFLAVVGDRKADRRTEAEELRMEIVACGQEMKAMAIRISNALAADDLHSAQHYAGRLWVLGSTYTDGSAA